MGNRDLEKTLERLSLARPSKRYVSRAREVLRIDRACFAWQKRLNYVLTLGLVISFGVNLMQAGVIPPHLESSGDCRMDDAGTPFIYQQQDD